MKRSPITAAVTLAFAFAAYACSEAPVDSDDDGGTGGTTATGTGGGDCTPPVDDPTADPCSAPLAPGSERKCTFEFNGQQRSFLVYAPPSYDACRPSAVVMDAHGATETAEQHAGLEQFNAFPTGLGSGWRLVADREGFIVVTPQGVGNVWNESDVDFIVEAQRLVTTIANVDDERVFLTGISNGGFLNYWTACSGVDVFKGYAPIAAGSNAATCDLSQAAPLIAFHAVGDSVVSYSLGEQGVELYAQSMGCTSGPTASTIYGGANGEPGDHCLTSTNGGAPWSLVPCDTAAPASTCETWDGCNGGQRVTFCDVAAQTQPVGGHILYFNDTNLSLASAAWSFFESL